MGKSKAKMMQDSISAQCGQLLVDFLNEEGEDKATINLLSNVSNKKNLPMPKIKGTNKKGKKFIIGRNSSGSCFPNFQRRLIFMMSAPLMIICFNIIPA